MKGIISILTIVSLATSVYAKDLISITAVGDIMMGTTYPASALPENNGKDLFTPAQQWIQASDIRFGNFEGTFFDGPPQNDGKAPGPNRYLFRTPPEMIEGLKDFNVVSLSNNHSRDFGKAGLVSTKKILAAADIQYSSKTGNEVAIFDIDGTIVSLIAVDFYKGPRSITEPASTYLEISQLKAENKLVIVSVHAGAEGGNAEVLKFGPEIFLGENRGDSIEFAHQAIDAGADVIIMHGPHVPRAIELYKNRLIAYSLGNFMTGQGISIEGSLKLAPLLRIQIDHQGEFRSGQIVSFLQKRNPQRIELDTKHKALGLIRTLSYEQFPESGLVFEENGILNKAQ